MRWAFYLVWHSGMLARFMELEWTIWNHFIEGLALTVIGAISLKQMLAVMTMNGAMDGDAFKVFIEKCLVPQLWPGAVEVNW